MEKIELLHVSFMSSFNIKIIAHMEGVQKGIRMTIYLSLNWGIRSPQIRTTPKIDKNMQVLTYFLCKISKHINYDISILISLNLYILHNFWQCSNLEVPAKRRRQSRWSHTMKVFWATFQFHFDLKV